MTFASRFAPMLSALLVLSASWSTPSHAQDDRATARAAFEQGVAAYSEGRYDEALEAFQNAHRIAPHPTVRVNMANCYEQLNRPVEALGQFERFLVEADDADSAQRREVRAAIERLEATIGEIFFRIEPEGATVTIDDTVTLRAPILDAVKLVQGPHTVRVTSPGFAPYEQRIEVEGGARRELRIALSEAAPMDTQTEMAPEEEEGEEDQGTSRGRVRLTTPVIIAGGATVVLGVTAVILGATALGADSDFEDAVVQSNDPSLSAADRAAARERGLDAQDKANRRSLTADILGVGAAVAGAATVVFLLLSRNQDEDAMATSLSPDIGRDSAGLRLRGRF